MFLLFVVSAITLTGFTNSWSGEVSHEATQLLNEMPACSRLHSQIARGEYGDGIDRPFMREMRTQGVQRAYFVVNTTLHDGAARVERRIYYRRYDEANSQITDLQELAQIVQSGLQSTLDQIALRSARDAPPFPGGRKHSRAKIGYTDVEFLSTPWLRPIASFISPLEKTIDPLYLAAGRGDSVQVAELIGHGHFQRERLDRALFYAVGNLYDNTTVINQLIAAGADVNATSPDSDGNSLVLTAVSRPCNLRALLEKGADPNSRNRFGVSARKAANDSKNVEALHILEQAGAK